MRQLTFCVFYDCSPAYVIFLIWKFSVLRGNHSNSKKLENEFIVPKFCSKGEKLTQPKYLDRYFEYEQRDLFNDQLSRTIKRSTQV